MICRLSSAAQSDLDDCWLHIARDNPQAADRLLDTVEKKMMMLAGHPNLGRKCDELGPHLHRFSAGSCVIFYLIQAKHIEIVRILHGARDIEAILNPPGD